MKNLIFHHGNILIKHCKHGYFAFNEFDETIGNSLNNYGEWCEGEFDFFKEVINSGDIVLDIGAYIGTHTVFFAQQVGTLGKVLAFEPQRSSFQLLNTNLTLNALYNTHCFQAGLSDEIGVIKLPVADPYEGRNYGGLSIEGYQQGEELSILTIDSLHLKQCDHIKIDVEGMEAKVLRGGRETIKRLRPILYVENNDVDKSSEIIQLLLEMNYDCWWHFIPYYNQNNFFGSKENIFSQQKRSFEANIACFPAEQAIKPTHLIPVSGINDNWKIASKQYN
jgi:FkbM family methyltransferase